MSELRTNKIYPRDGLPSGASGGGIVQIVQNSLNSSGQVATSSQSMQDSGLTATITPTSSSNKIYVVCTYNAATGNNTNSGLRATIYRGTIASGTNLLSGGGQGSTISFSSAAGYIHDQCCIQVLDSPATTSAITYRLAFNSYSGQSVGLAKDWGGAWLTLMEVSG